LFLLNSRIPLVSNSSNSEVNEQKLHTREYVHKDWKECTKSTVSSTPYTLIHAFRIPPSQLPFLPFEPTIFPKLQVNFADFPYLRSAIRPEASNLEDLMRLSVRRYLKII
jgi:hypothetical protein